MLAINNTSDIKFVYDSIMRCFKRLPVQLAILVISKHRATTQPTVNPTGNAKTIVTLAHGVGGRHTYLALLFYGWLQ